jgi:hypothetical protein
VPEVRQGVRPLARRRDAPADCGMGTGGSVRVPPSKRDNLAKNGAQMRVWKDSRAKLRTMAALLGKDGAEVFDELVHAALQSQYDGMEVEDAETTQP